MSTIGNLDEDLVNASSTKVFIRPSAADIEYVKLQDKDLDLGHEIVLEPHTGGGLDYFTGAIDSTLTGTVLLTTDMASATGGFTELNTKTNGELPTKTWKMKITDRNNTTQEWSFTAVLERFRISGPATGATKYEIILRILTEPTIS